MTAVFVTTDWCVIEPGDYGLDPDDVAAMMGARPVHPADAMRLMQEEAPHQRYEPPSAPLPGMEPLTRERLEDLGQRAISTAAVFANVARFYCADMERTLLVRRWRVLDRLTWRAIARAAAETLSRDPAWHPRSNQLLGMVLCKEAAKRLGEDPNGERWNGPRA